MQKSKTFSWIAGRLREPSTYAGLATGAIAVAEVAKEAHTVAVTFKDAGKLAGGIALMASIVAICRSEKAAHDPNIVEAEFTVVDPKKDKE